MYFARIQVVMRWMVVEWDEIYELVKHLHNFMITSIFLLIIFFVHRQDDRLWIITTYYSVDY